MSEANHAVEKDGELNTSKIEQTIDRMGSGRKEEILADFNEFKSYLSKRVALGKSIGLNEEQLAVAAEKVAGYLAEREEPRNAEENLLRELWSAGDEDQRHKLAHMLVKLAEQQ